MKLRKLTCLLMTLVMSALCAVPASAAQKREFARVGFEEKSLKAKMEQVVVFMEDNHEAYVKNLKYDIESGDNFVKPYSDNSVLYIPIEFTVTHMGGKCSESDGEAHVELDGKNITFKSEEKADGCEYKVSKFYKKLFMAAEDFSRIFDKDLLLQDGLAVLTFEPDKLGALSFKKSELDKLKETLSYEWQNVYLGAMGYATGVMAHPKDKTQLYCRTDVGGAYRYITEHNKWVSITDAVVESRIDQEHRKVMGMALDPNDTETIYLATVADVLKTTDGGTTWKELNLKRKLTDDENRLLGEPIVVDPNNSDIIYFGGDSDGVFVSRDAGNNWVQAMGLPSNSDFGVRCIVPDPTSADENGVTQTVYAGVSGYGVYVSHNAGKSFSKMPGSPTHPARMELAGGRLYVTMTKAKSTMPTSMNSGVYVCRNNKWENITPKQSNNKHFNAIAVRENNPNFVIAAECSGSSKWYRTVDGGKNWEVIQGLGDNVADMIFNPLDESEMFYVFGAGLNKITNIDSQLPQVSRFDTGIEEFCTAQVMSVPGAKAKVFTGNLDWGTYKNYEFDERAIRIGNPFCADTQAMDYCEGNPSLVFVGGSTGNYGKGISAFEISKDGGENWDIISSWNSGNFMIDMAVGAQPAADGYPVVMVTGISGDAAGEWVSRDGLKTWEKMDVAYSKGTSIWSRWNKRLASDRVNGNVFYSCAGNNFYVTNDCGRSWKQASVLPAIAEKYTRIEPAFGLEGTIAYTASTGLYISRDYGYSWEECRGVEWSFASSWGKGSDGKTPALYVYGVVNGVTGVFISDDLGKNWRRINDNATPMPNMYDCAWLCGDKNVYGRVFVTTHGRGTLVGQPITVNDTAPIITLDTDDGIITRDEIFTVKGSVSQPAEVRVNNETAQINGDFEFAHDVKLSEGENKIRIEAVSDGKYKANPKYINVTYKPGYLGLKLNRTGRFYASGEAVEIIGEATNSSDIYINDEYKLKTDEKNAFSIMLPIYEGDNIYNIYAKDESGNKSQAIEINAVKDTTYPEYTVENAEETSETAYQIIKLTMNEDGQFRINKKNVVSAKKDSPVEYFIGLLQGQNEITIEARDEVGNVGRPQKLIINSLANLLDTSYVETKYVEPGKITIDGKLDEDVWIGDKICTKVVEGIPNNICRFDIYWNEEYVYFGTKVQDSEMVFNSNNVFEDDCIEVYIDADNCHGEKYCSHARQLQYRADAEVTASGTICKSKMVEGGYTMEIAIPWSLFKTEVREGALVGFDFTCIDDDGLNASGARSGVLNWNNDVNNNYVSCKDYATMKLIK